MTEETKGRGLVVLLVGVAGMLLLIGGFYLVSYFAPAPAKVQTRPLPMGPAEQAYVQQIQFLEPKVARASNFLNQQVTFVFGTVANNGSRPIQQIEVTLEFHDVFHQVVLRDKERLFSSNAPPLAPSGRRDFQLGFETLPAQWNQAYPSIRITGLALK